VLRHGSRHSHDPAQPKPPLRSAFTPHLSFARRKVFSLKPKASAALYSSTESTSKIAPFADATAFLRP